MVILLRLAAAYSPYVCTKSGFCSGDKVKGYIGPLNTNTEVKAMLGAVTYKRNLIVSEAKGVEYGAQWLWRMQRAGYYHSVRMSGNNMLICLTTCPQALQLLQ